MTTPIEQHNLEIHENRKGWDRKPSLRFVYGEFYREIGRRIRRDVAGEVVELGSGLGNTKTFLPGCITTDIFPNPWIDRVEDAYRLNFAAGSISNLILFDVWHHLEFPGTALREFRRVLAPGGRVIVFDPAMGWIGKFVFGLFHHEPLGLKNPIRWEAPEGSDPAEFPYYAAQGNASRIFGSGKFQRELTGWRIKEVTYLSGLAYVATGGFRGPQVAPDWLIRGLHRADQTFSKWRFLASRMLVVLEPESGDDEKRPC